MGLRRGFQGDGSQRGRASPESRPPSCITMRYAGIHRMAWRGSLGYCGRLTVQQTSRGNVMLVSKLCRAAAALSAGARALVRARRRAELSEPADPHHRADAARRRRRSAGARGRAGDFRQHRQDRDRRAAHRRRRRDRGRLRREGGARRLHHLHGLPSDPVDPGAPAEAALRPGQGFRADHRWSAPRPTCWWCIPSLPAKTPKELVDTRARIPARSRSARPATARPATWSASSSRSCTSSTSCTCPTRARGRR